MMEKVSLSSKDQFWDLGLNGEAFSAKGAQVNLTSTACVLPGSPPAHLKTISQAWKSLH